MGYKLDFLEPGGPSLKEVGDIGGRVISKPAPALEPTGMWGKAGFSPRFLSQIK